MFFNKLGVKFGEYHPCATSGSQPIKQTVMPLPAPLSGQFACGVEVVHRFCHIPPKTSLVIIGTATPEIQSGLITLRSRPAAPRLISRPPLAGHVPSAIQASGEEDDSSGKWLPRLPIFEALPA